MRLLNFYLWLLNRDEGTKLTLVEVDGSYLVSGTMRHLTEVNAATTNQGILAQTLKRMDKLSKAHYEMQMWKGAQAISVLLKAGIREDVATEIVGQCIRSGKDPEMLIKHPEYVKTMAEKIQELMDRG